MKRTDIRKLTVSSLFCALLVVSAFISIPVPFLAIKITLQTMIIFIACAVLPPVYSFTSVFLYVLLGLFGLPVFSGGSGPMYVLSPSFGFLIGMIIASPIMSKINRLEFSKKLIRYIVSCVVGTIIIYLIGVPYLYIILKLHMNQNINFSYALVFGGLMFLPFDLLKAIIAYPIVVLLRKNLKLTF